MKMKGKQSSKPKVNIKLKTRLIYAVVSFALLGIIAFAIFFYLTLGNSRTAQAAVTNISGVINSYLRVTAINAGTKKFTCDNLSGSIADFAAGKTIMVHQAKGATIDVTNTSAYGDVSSYGSAGNYEFAVVSSISGSGPYTIKISSLVNSYSASDYTQLISVPVYTDAAVTGTITATAWDATQGRGGVVALQASNTLTLGANIDVSGQGFAGGVVGGSDGSCPDNATYTLGTNNYGAKGDGGSTNGQLYARGAQMNGGGGGNTHNAGGGGGGNHTYGGNGGQGWQPGGSCTSLNAGGVGGKKINYATLTNKSFFGGGGGSGQQNNGLGSSGASGGGIIVIRAKTVKSTCGGTYGFIADGANAANSGGNDGAGGGGGDIVLDVVSYVLTCNIVVRSNGGSGGSVTDPAIHGGGGGAGVGIIMETIPTTNVRVTTLSTIGVNGQDCSTCTTASGSPAGTPTSSKMAITSIPGSVVTLPIKLLYFNGAVDEEGVELNWATSMEENNDYFTIERSFDGIKFDSILTVPGAGNSKSKLTYTALDKNIFAPTTYYKLKQTDYDRKSTYSNVIFVDTHDLQRSDITLFPNPASKYLNVINPAGGPISIQILNSTGKVEVQQEGTELETKIDVDHLNNGIYIVQTVVGGKKQNLRLVIKR